MNNDMTSAVAVISLVLFCLCSAAALRAWASIPSESQLKPSEHPAHVAYDNGRYLESISLLKQALALDPKNPWFLTDMGSAQNEASNFTGALFYFKKALAAEPKHIGALVGIAVSLEHLDNQTQAIMYYKQALSIPIPLALSKQAWIQTERAEALTRLGNYSQAIEIANKILKRNATNLDGLEVKGVALLYLKNATAALDILNKVRPVATWVLDNKGIALTELGNYTGAVLTLNTALTQHPRDEYAFYNSFLQS